MKEHMKYIIDHAEEIEKLLKVKAQVSEVKSIMLENIDKVLFVQNKIWIFSPLSSVISTTVVIMHLVLTYNPFLCSISK